MYICISVNIMKDCGLNQSDIDRQLLWRLMESIVSERTNHRLAEVFRYISFSPHEIYGFHRHYRVEINYVKRGNCILHLDKECVTFREGEIMVIRSNVNHKFEAGSKGVTILQLEFIPELFLSLPINETSQSDEIFGVFSGNDELIKIVSDIKIMRIMHNIVTELKNKSPYYEQFVLFNYGELYLLLHRFLKENYLPMCHNTVIQHAVKYMRETYPEGITISEIAQECGVSERYLRVLFTKYMNSSPLDYLNTIRINKSVDLLQHSNLSIKEICYQCGFTTPQSFSRVFKQYMGISPRDFSLSPPL